MEGTHSPNNLLKLGNVSVRRGVRTDLTIVPDKDFGNSLLVRVAMFVDNRQSFMLGRSLRQAASPSDL